MTLDGSEQLRDFNVSRETIERLKLYVELVEKWNPRINLVSKSSLNDIWTRHIVDSVQIFEYGAATGSWVDLGSGGGFPGAVVGILAAERDLGLNVTLIESDQRKCAFLRTVARETHVPFTVLSERIDKVPVLKADTISARALADLSTVLGFMELHQKPGGVGLFPKGESWKKEIEVARQQWQFEYEAIRSKTEPKAVIVKISGVSRV